MPSNFACAVARERSNAPLPSSRSDREIGGVPAILMKRLGRTRRPLINLGIKIKGTPPTSLSLKDEGNMDFERSRVVAQAKLDSVIEEARTKQGSVRLVEKLYEIKTGEVIRTVLLENLFQEWAKIPRRRKLDERYSSQCQSTLKRFAAFVRSENTKATEIAHVTRTAAQSFLDAESKRGVTAKTWNETLKLLRTTFKHLLPIGAINPFSTVPTRETETIFRKPYSPEELAAILEAARTDEFIRPILITGICSAMRRGDCCLLDWTKLDLENLFISVKTAKTGDKIVTSSGIHGVITNVKETTVIVRVADNVKLEIEKTHLDKIIRPDASSTSEKAVAAKA